ncbi:DUF4124 domain-containing protein [Cellvibrio sp. pealriver]|uniref:DUF4124 domain-containing protein n=1 Tax=Cellvibrio sp. pealriver TaxID=1622269 RepID=UPI0018CDAA50|nr:DUF4124 domain-containing protein [Cellvibrio sp. pealriver]
MKYLRLIGFCMAALALSQSAIAAKVYTWKDKNGVVHYGERPPKDVQATLVKTRTGHSEPTPEQIAASQPKPAAEQQPAAQSGAQQSLKDPERCAAARENLEILNTVARLRIQNADGIMVPMTEEDKKQQRIEAQKVIEQACE